MFIPLIDHWVCRLSGGGGVPVLSAPLHSSSFMLVARGSLALRLHPRPLCVCPRSPVCPFKSTSLDFHFRQTDGTYGKETWPGTGTVAAAGRGSCLHRVVSPFLLNLSFPSFHWIEPPRCALVLVGWFVFPPRRVCKFYFYLWSGSWGPDVLTNVEISFSVGSKN